MQSDTLTQAVAELSKELTISPPEPAADGSVTFTFSNDLALTCFTRNGALYLKGLVAHLPHLSLSQLQIQALYKRLLQTSLGIMKESAVSLCLTPDEKDIILYRRIIPCMHKRVSIVDAAEEFLNRLEMLRAKTTAPQYSRPPDQIMFMRP
ncbi:CesT family type III secretion system chaperone [Halodesulfovibrio sp.]|uniref:CesT family type III secretion system chaperone n=1 Tax=Halodesulfovibrio sp. TaxID=1912772 RepID=UPI0025C326E9|nr:CesT family type III secretion system chaperone [Halodesulfovibrio sp.]